jgi:hypothetical protein
LASSGWTTELSLAWLQRATVFGVLGLYTHCEVIEVLGFSKEQPDTPVNVFSL